MSLNTFLTVHITSKLLTGCGSNYSSPQALNCCVINSWLRCACQLKCWITFPVSPAVLVWWKSKSHTSQSYSRLRASQGSPIPSALPAWPRARSSIHTTFQVHVCSRSVPKISLLLVAVLSFFPKGAYISLCSSETSGSLFSSQLWLYRDRGSPHRLLTLQCCCCCMLLGWVHMADPHSHCGRRHLYHLNQHGIPVMKWPFRVFNHSQLDWGVYCGS